MLRSTVALDAEGGYPAAPVPDYANEGGFTKVAKIIQSYAGIVDRMDWRKRQRRFFSSADVFGSEHLCSWAG